MTTRALIENVSRRRFLTTAATAAGFVVAAQMVPFRSAFAYETGADKMPHGVVTDPHVFVSIDPSGIVTIVTHRSEMGTGSRTSLPMVVADEMEADWSKVRIMQAEGNEQKYGNQDTDGSRSIRHFTQPMRACGAAARQMLEHAAALTWGVSDADCRAQNHKVIHTPTGRSLGYGELAAVAAKLKTPAESTLTLKDPSQFRYIGKGQVQITDLRDITMGKATYAQDIHVPG